MSCKVSFSPIKKWPGGPIFNLRCPCKDLQTSSRKISEVNVRIGNSTKISTPEISPLPGKPNKFFVDVTSTVRNLRKIKHQNVKS